MRLETRVTMRAPLSPAPAAFDSASARDLLERFMELGDRHLFKLNDGRAFDCFVVEIGEDALLVMDAGPNSSDEPIEIPLSAVDLGTLRYVDGDTVVPFVAA